MPLPFIRRMRILKEGNRKAAYNFPHRGAWGRRRPRSYTQNNKLKKGNLKAAYKFHCRGTYWRRCPFPLYAEWGFWKREIAGLRINFPVEVHGDGDVFPFIRRMRILKEGNRRAAYKFPHRNGSPFPLYAKCRLAYKWKNTPTSCRWNVSRIYTRIGAVIFPPTPRLYLVS